MWLITYLNCDSSFNEIICTEISENKKMKIFWKNAFNAISRRRRRKRRISAQPIWGRTRKYFWLESWTRNSSPAAAKGTGPHGDHRWGSQECEGGHHLDPEGGHHLDPQGRWQRCHGGGGGGSRPRRPSRNSLRETSAAPSTTAASNSTPFGCKFFFTLNKNSF